MNKIGVVGDRESVLGFMSVGFDVFEAADAQSAAECISRMAKDNYAIIFITQSYAKQIADVIKKYSNKITPAIIPIPDRNGSEYGEELLKDAVVRAIGADILFKD